MPKKRTARLIGTGRTVGPSTERFMRNMRFVLEHPAFEPPPSPEAARETASSARTSSRRSSGDDTARDRLDAAQMLVKPHGHRLAALEPKWAGMEPSDAAQELAHDKARFATRMEALGRKDRKLRLEGSELMTQVLAPGNTAAIDSHRARAEKERLARRGGQEGPQSVRTARHNKLFFKEDRNGAKSSAVFDHAQKMDKTAGFNRTKGDIIGFGNFAQFAGICVANHIKLGATGHC